MGIKKGSGTTSMPFGENLFEAICKSHACVCLKYSL